MGLASEVLVAILGALALLARLSHFDLGCDVECPREPLWIWIQFVAQSMFWKQQICRLWLGAALCVCLVSNGLGNDIWLKENELRSGLGGATIDGQYVDARGFREHYNADGSLNYEEPVGNAKLGGRW